MNDTRPVFLLLTANKCGHCASFKSNVWPELQSALNATGKVRVETVEVSSMSHPVIPSGKPAGLLTYSRWYPMILMIPGDAWNGAMANPSVSTDLRAVAFNAQGSGSNMESVNSYKRDKQGIMDWVQSILSRPDFSSRNPPIQVANPYKANAAPVAKGGSEVCSVRMTGPNKGW